MIRARLLYLLMAGAGAACAQGDGGVVERLLRPLEPSRPSPLTEKERFHLYLRSTVGVLPVFLAGASAGVGQGIDSPKEWEQGGSGYGKRLGNNLATNSVRATLTYASSIAFHEDNRYFASGDRRVWRRLAHALTATVRARHDDGRESVSVSTFVGIAGAAAISRAWAPPSWQGGANIGRSIGFAFASKAGINVAREFLPALLRRHR
jgi:hypothetical protein